MGIIKEKTFSSASKEDLDQQVNDFIGKHIVDSAVLDRQVKFFQFVVVGATLYTSVIYEEINLSGNGD